MFSYILCNGSILRRGFALAKTSIEGLAECSVAKESAVGIFFCKQAAETLGDVLSPQPNSIFDCK